MKIIDRLVERFLKPAQGTVQDVTDVPDYIREKTERAQQIRNGEIEVDQNRRGAGYYASRSNAPD